MSQNIYKLKSLISSTAMILVQVPVPLRAVHGLFAEVGPLTKCLGSAFLSGVSVFNTVFPLGSDFVLWARYLLKFMCCCCFF